MTGRRTTPLSGLLSPAPATSTTSFVSGGGDEYAPSAVPSGAVFDLNAFTSDPTGFLATFAQAKLGEIETTPETPGNVIPLPASIPLLLTGLGAIGVLRARRKA